jgi:uncharacterized membrane protein
MIREKEMIPEGTDPNVCLDCELASACPLIFPQCLEKIMKDKAFIKQATKIIEKILCYQIETYFDNKVTPQNIKLIEEYVNRFLFDKFIADGYRFELELECKKEGNILVTGFKSFKMEC